MNENQCRLCGDKLADHFKVNLLHKYEVQYYICLGCHSLQTEQPFWLDEAYDENFVTTDTGAVQRNIQNFAGCLVISKLFNVKTAVDFGGGDGLLCRFLRDYDIDCYINDKYAKPRYSRGFTEPPFNRPDLVMAFEVFEHLVNPSIELDAIFSLNPNVLMVTTELFNGQQAEWPYLATECGQHIFFYSAKAILMLAEKYGYIVETAGFYYLFVKNNLPDAAKNIAIAQELLKGWFFQAIKSYIFLLPAPGVAKDHLFLKSLK